MELTPGSRLDNFEILSRVGEGGMGVVFRARDHDLGRDVAIKVLSEELSADDRRVERFKQEARAASALNHPNIVTIYAIGASEAGLYLVMELVSGRTLRAVAEDGPIPLEQLFQVARQTVEGLAKAHEAGIVHRDLKPENLMLTDDGRVKILDFGLAKLARDDENNPTVVESEATLTRGLTKPGVVVGTIAYMSPEQLGGRPVDPRSDQFALGTILYELATGVHPFRRSTSVQTLSAILDVEPEPMTLHRREVPEAVIGVIDRLLSKAPGARYDQTLDILDELGRGAVSGSGPGTERPAAPALPSFLKESSEDARAPVFVGREPELDRLNASLDDALQGSGQVRMVTGDAGTGKTSLLSEFMRLAQERHEDLVVAFGNCDAQTGIGDPYLPFREILALVTGDVEARRAAGAMSRDHALRLWHLIPHSVELLFRLGPDLLDTLLPGEALLSRARQALGPVERPTSSPSPEQAALFEQCTQFLSELSRHRPLLLALEDLHWADAGTVGLLFHLCRRLEGHRILILGSYRPAELGRDLEAPLHELKRTFGELEIAVGEVSGQEFVEQMVDFLPNRLGDGFREALFRHTRGHPLFTVELLRELRDSGMLVQDADGLYVEHESLSWEGLPARVEAVIAERIARLPEELQQILKLASVEGEEFTAEVIAGIEGRDEREVVRLLSDQLDKRHRLVLAHDMKRSGSQRLSIYRFRHILFQKYVYQRLDRVERSYLHESVGMTLEGLVGEASEEWAVHLARHFDEAAFSAKAIDYLSRAGDRAVRLAANGQAIEHFERAVSLLEELPASQERDAQELSLQLALGNALLPVRGFGAPECERAFSRAAELATESTPAEQQLKTFFGLWIVNTVRLDFVKSTPLAERMLAVADGEPDTGLELQALHACWTDALFRGDLEKGLGYCERGVSLYRPDEHHPLTFAYSNHDPGACALSIEGWIHALSGRSRRAQKGALEAVALSERLSHRVTRTFIRAFTLPSWQHMGDVSRALSIASDAVSDFSKHDHPICLALGRAVYGWAKGRKGEDDVAVSELTSAVALLDKIRQFVFVPYVLGLLAEVHLDNARSEEGDAALGRAFDIVERAGRHYYASELHRLRGESKRLHNDESAARRSFERAIEVADGQGAHLLVLRAALSLTRPDVANTRSVLASALDRLPEENDTVFRREAESLLST